MSGVSNGGKSPELEVVIRLDVERLVALRVLCSQVGFAIDNYLLALREIEAKRDE